MATCVALVSCVKSKQKFSCQARDLYASQLFSGMRAYAEQNAESWFILSAEHGLLRPDQVVAPYEKTLNKMCKIERVEWASRVGQSLLAELKPNTVVIILAGLRYREGIVPILETNGFTVKIPMEGMKFGHQLSWLKMQARLHE